MVTDNNQLKQWQACRCLGRAAAGAQPLHGRVVGARGGQQACCSVGGAAVGHWWR
jgi:hypothetical protein